MVLNRIIIVHRLGTIPSNLTVNSNNALCMDAISSAEMSVVSNTNESFFIAFVMPSVLE